MRGTRYHFVFLRVISSLYFGISCSINRFFFFGREVDVYFCLITLIGAFRHHQSPFLIRAMCTNEISVQELDSIESNKLNCRGGKTCAFCLFS